MSLKVSAQSQINAAFKAMGDLVKNAVYKECTGESRDPETYEAVHTYKETQIRCVVTSYKRHEIEFAAGDIMVTDKKVLIPRQGLLVELKSNAEIVIDSTSHLIIDVKTDPTESLYIVQARA